MRQPQLFDTDPQAPRQAHPESPLGDRLANLPTPDGVAIHAHPACQGLLGEADGLPELAYSHVAGGGVIVVVHRTALSPIQGGAGYCVMLETELTFQHSSVILRRQGPPGTSRRPTSEPYEGGN